MNRKILYKLTLLHTVFKNLINILNPLEVVSLSKIIKKNYVNIRKIFVICHDILIHADKIIELIQNL